MLLTQVKLQPYEHDEHFLIISDFRPILARTLPEHLQHPHLMSRPSRRQLLHLRT